MSYNISFNIKVDGTNDYWEIDRPSLYSPTYNLKKMFVACMDWNFIQAKYYRCSEVLPLIKRGIEELECKEWYYKQFEDVNGWGTVEMALDVLHEKGDCLNGNSKTYERRTFNVCFISHRRRG